MTLRRVIVGVDGSESAAEALRWTVELARGSSTEVVVVHAAPAGEAHSVTMQDLDEWCATLRDAHIAYRCMFIDDADPRVALPQVADEEDADLVVVGSRGQNTLTQLVVGSVGLGLAHRGDRPVAIVHARPSE